MQFGGTAGSAEKLLWECCAQSTRRESKGNRLPWGKDWGITYFRGTSVF